jgi:hypothetical protein
MEQEIVKLYVEESLSINDICKKFHIGKLKVKEILNKNNIQLNKKGGQKKHLIIDIDYAKYKNKVLKCKKTDKIINDTLNRSGFVLTHLKNVYGLNLPSLYKRQMITKTTGKLWYEDYFDLVDEVIKEKWNCPVCNWSTNDVKNQGGFITKHIKKHGFSSIKDF